MKWVSYTRHLGHGKGSDPGFSGTLKDDKENLERVDGTRESLNLCVPGCKGSRTRLSVGWWSEYV